MNCTYRKSTRTFTYCSIRNVTYRKSTRTITHYSTGTITRKTTKTSFIVLYELYRKTTRTLTHCSVGTVSIEKLQEQSLNAVDEQSKHKQWAQKLFKLIALIQAMHKLTYKINQKQIPENIEDDKCNTNKIKNSEECSTFTSSRSIPHHLSLVIFMGLPGRHFIKCQIIFSYTKEFTLAFSVNEEVRIIKVNQHFRSITPPIIRPINVKSDLI